MKSVMRIGGFEPRVDLRELIEDELRWRCPGATPRGVPYVVPPRPTTTLRWLIQNRLTLFRAGCSVRKDEKGHKFFWL